MKKHWLRGLVLGVSLALLLAGGVALADKEPPDVAGEGVAALSTGGPDSFGYTYVDSNEPGGPSFDWVVIFGSGTAIGITDDSFHGPFDIGFTFNFYGNDYTQFYVTSNGMVTFDGGSGSDLGNDCPLPDADGNDDFIAGVWDDLHPSNSGDAYYESFGSCPLDGYSGACLVVAWNVVHFGTTDTVTFQIILIEENSDFLIQIFNASSEAGIGSTTGIENADASDGLTYACNDDGSIADQLAVLFYHPDRAEDEDFVPEPGSILLLGSGLVGLAGYATLRWRTRE